MSDDENEPMEVVVNDDDDAGAVQVVAIMPGRDPAGIINGEDGGDEDEPVEGLVAEVDEVEDDGDDLEDDEADEVEAVAMVVEEDQEGGHGEEDIVEAAAELDDAVNVHVHHPAVAVAMEADDEDVPEVEAVAILEEAPVKTTAVKDTATTKSRSTTKKPVAFRSQKETGPGGSKAKSSNASSTATKKRKKPKAGNTKTSSNASPFARIDIKRMEAATLARELLYEAVPRLPFTVNDQSTDQYHVRNFGRLKVGNDKFASKYSTSNALYPIGFSCDRYEFSPSHGRTLKLRCSIIDGKGKGEAGPIFRVMWGQGVDGDADKVEYPYDPFTNSAPITASGTGNDVVAVPTFTGMHSQNVEVVPAPGMRVKARFAKDKYYHGTITAVVVGKEEDTGKSKKKKRKTIQITIQYDDGSSEEAVFPDPEISLVMPGNDDEVDEYGAIERTELNGKSVHTTIGRTPLEAWSLALIRLGLIDEVIVERAMAALTLARKANDSESRGKKNPSYKVEDDAKLDGSATMLEDDTTEQLDPDAEPYSEEEKSLRDCLDALKKEYNDAAVDDGAVAQELADARISLMGPMACNPFPEGPSSVQNQASFLAVAVRREKTKMGSTGNKRKVVNATDLLERSNTFFNGDVEALVEGLPGSEYSTNYIFLKKRATSSTSKAWIQDQQQRLEREKGKQSKVSIEAKAKASEVKEKEKKRKMLQDERDARKRQKMEEDEEVRKQREESRLAKLSLQIDDRLSKEAAFQREKVVLVLAKNLNKEMNRRRKAAELVAGQVASEMKPSLESRLDLPETSPLGREFDEDVLRIWDFLNTFSKVFIDRKYFEKPPSLLTLQSAFDALRGMESTELGRKESIFVLTDLAVAMCHPLSVVLTRMLFSSLIALNPTIQKEFNAAYWTEGGGGKTQEEENAEVENAFTSNVLLPVNRLTWKEIARMAFLSDALGELDHSRQETAHNIRGYRSTGHPNSKESKRLRKMEGVGIECLLQMFAEHRVKDDGYHGSHKIALIRTPSTPQCHPTDWMFYLHNLNRLRGLQKEEIERNLKTAHKLLNEGRAIDPALESFVEDLDTCIAIAKTDPKNARESGLVLLDKATGEVHSKRAIREVVDKEFFAEKTKHELFRPRMGQLSELSITRAETKELLRMREQYMLDAISFAEKERKDMNRAAEEDDEDDDDDDEDEDVPRAEVVKIEKSEDKFEAEIASDAPVKACTNSAVSENATEDDKEKHSEESEVDTPKKIGKETEYDDFCGDIPTAPILFRRCLAVLRTLTQSGPGYSFINPVDPQANPNYYEELIRPMSLREVGRRLQAAVKQYEMLTGSSATQFEEDSVAEFARNIRLIVRNALAYSNAGPMIVSAGGEMLKIFERLLFDWVLAPEEHLPPLETLDDDMCIHPHESDLESTVLVCDACEGKYNINRLKPPLRAVPQGEWYCPRCLDGRWWGTLDPRIGKTIVIGKFVGKIKKCLFTQPEDSNRLPSLMYLLESPSGSTNLFSLKEVDDGLSAAGFNIPEIKCLRAVAESIGYGTGIDHGRRPDVVPVLVNPHVSEKAARTSLSSTVFRDAIAAAGTLMINDTEELSADEWLRLLTLLLMACSSSDLITNAASEMESEAAERMAKAVASLSKISDFTKVLPKASYVDVADEHTSSPAQVLSQTQTGLNDPTSEDVESTERASESADNKGTALPEVVEANAVQVDAMEVDGVVSGNHVAFVEADTTNNEDDEDTKARKLAIAVKVKRQKAREEGIAAYCLKNQLRSTVASFEQDKVSQVVESTLAPKDPGLSFAQTRCRGLSCDFCGLADTTLCASLVRVPDESEWQELIVHATRLRRTQLVADFKEADKAMQKKRFLKISIRIGDELVSSEPEDKYFSETVDGGMLEFLPRNPDGFQDELQFRSEAGLPFVSGSMSAHECCAIAAHNARKIKVVETFKIKQASAIEREAGITCGRTLEIGSDRSGRSYWHFNSDLRSLFVCKPLGADNAKWIRYSEPEAISSVIVSLGKDSVATELRETFPEAADLIRSGEWSEMLMKRHYKLMERSPLVKGDDLSDVGLDKDEKFEPGDETELYEEGEDVLVESKVGDMLWDAKIIEVGKNGSDVAYRVSYKGWSSRFHEWVSSDRVIEPNDHNKEVQEEMIQDFVQEHDSLPTILEDLQARKSLNGKDRLRGCSHLPDFHRIAYVPESASSDERTFAAMQAAALAIEAALPMGSVDNTAKGPWRADLAEQWKLKVLQSVGPYDLMRCVLVLEEAIGEEWIRPDLGHLRSGLPLRAKALEEATPSSLAIRLILLDRSIAYNYVDKKRFKPSKKK